MERQDPHLKGERTRCKAVGNLKCLNQKRGKTLSSRHTFVLFLGNWKPFRVQNCVKEQWFDIINEKNEAICGKTDGNRDPDSKQNETESGTRMHIFLIYGT